MHMHAGQGCFGPVVLTDGKLEGVSTNVAAHLRDWIDWTRVMWLTEHTGVQACYA